MKKFLLAFAAFVSLGLQAQTTIYTQNFSSTSLPSGWQNVDNSGNGAGTWARKTSSHSFASTTASNGFWIFDSDAKGNDSKAENADLISAAINCSGYSHVTLQFEEFFAQYNASSGTVSVSTDNSNWSEVYSVTNSTDNPHLVKVDISGIAANQATVYIKFNYQGNYDYWWAVDDIKLYEPAAVDVAVSGLTLTKYVGLSDQAVKGTLTNEGYNNITSVELSYTVNGGAPVNQSLSGLNIQPFQSYSFQFGQLVQMSTAQVYDITVTASAPNLGSDANLANNTQQGTVIALSAIPQKSVVLEEFTTVPCGYCPGGATRVNEVEADATVGSKVIPVAIHAGFGTDGMTIAEHSTLAAAFASGAPTACIDRVLWEGEEDVAVGVAGMGSGPESNYWLELTTDRAQQVVPANIAATSTYDAGTRAISASVTANFFAAVSGDFRLNLYVIEDSVVGSGSGYDQHSYYHDSPTSLNPWLNVGTSNLGSGTWAIAGYVHNHLLRKAVGGAWGTTSIVPSTTSDGGQYTYQYSYTLPSGWNADHCHLVAMVHEYNSNAKSGHNEIMNAVELPLNGSVSQTSTPSQYQPNGIAELNVNNISLYPNPATNVVNINYSVANDSRLSFEVYNVLGQNVYSTAPNQFGKGDFKTSINTAGFENGVYFVSVKDNGRVINTLRFVISK